MPRVLTIADVRGGINNSDSPTLIADNEVVDARNADFRSGALGAKRRGTTPIDLNGSVFTTQVVAVMRHTPTNDVGDDELWGIDADGNLDRRVGGTWQGGVTRVNSVVTIRPNNFDANGVSLHGKLFLAAQSDVDRLLVWDGAVLRWAGLAAPPPPTAADDGAGSYAGTRYFRIRYIERVGGVTLRRSEPSTTLVFVPSGTGSGAEITKPSGTENPATATYEGQTHWEIEASIDNILFYQIATVAIGTATYVDTTALAVGYSLNPLSEQIGEYVPPTAPRHVAVDEDRLVMAGSWFTPGHDATVWWTPVSADDGVGNDERVPITTAQSITFDGLDGGAVTGLVSGVAGNVYVFKLTRIYKMVRTGQLASAYDPVSESFSRGSVLRGACAGSDLQGVPCAYFLDPAVGLCRIGRMGVEVLGRPIRSTWRGRNPFVAVGPRILYYPELEQVWFTSPIDDPQAVQTAESTNIQTANGSFIFAQQSRPGLLVEFEARYGGIMFHDGLLGDTTSMTLFPTEDGVKPVIGTTVVTATGGIQTSLHVADSGTDDSGTPFRAYVRTKPYVLGDLWTRFGIMAAAVLARAAAGTSLLLRLIRNFEAETTQTLVDLSPAGSEPHVVKPVDDSHLSSLNVLQVEYGDEAASAQAWDVDRLVFKVRGEDEFAG